MESLEIHFEKKAKAVLIITESLGWLGVVYTFIFAFAFNATAPAVTCAISAFLGLSFKFIYRSGKIKKSLLLHYPVTVYCYCLTSLAYYTGGINAIAVWWQVGTPILAVYVLRARAAMAWGALTLFIVTGFLAMELTGTTPPSVLGRSYFLVLQYVDIIFLVITVFMLSYLLDHSTSKLLEEREEIQSKAFVSAKQASLGVMASGVAHEINNPLTILNGMIAILKAKVSKDTDAYELYFEKLEKTVQRVQVIVDGMKLLARDGSNDEFEEISLLETIGSIIEVSRERASYVKVLIKSDIENVSLFCQKTNFSQAILNLVSNGIDAAKDSEEKWVHVSAKIKDDGRLLVKVVDSGQILEEDIAKLIQPFYTTKNPGEGTGLGLSLVERVVTEHAGELSVDQEQGHTCFKIEFSKNFKKIA